jgi:Sugar-specific transcriptional regulator TrmB
MAPEQTGRINRSIDSRSDLYSLLGLADLVQSGPKTAEQLADAAGLHAPSLYRLLRALASVGVFIKQEEGRFAQTPTDLEMLVISSYGRERTRVEWENLLRASGFQLTSTIPTNSGVSVIEAVRDHPVS